MEHKVSVILSLYNGASYIEEQLNSIINQTYDLYEILILDDCSPDFDKSIVIIDKFLKKYNFIKLLRNDKNMGWQYSFMKLTSIASGDIIFFSDQDDIWVSNKVELMIKQMDKYSANVMISKTVNFIDNFDNKLLLKIKDSNQVYNNTFKFNTSFMNPKGVGAAMSIRKEFIDKYSYLWVPNFAHDRFFQILAVIFDKLYYYDKTLIFHRIHASNATGKRNYKIDDRILYTSNNIKFINKLIIDIEMFNFTKKQKKIIYNSLIFNIKRLQMLKSKSFCQLMCLSRYVFSYYTTKKTWVGDFLTLLKSKRR